MLSNFIFVLVIIMVIIVTISERNNVKKQGVKLTANEIMRRHIVIYCLLFMIFSVITGGISLFSLFIDFSIMKVSALCVCILVFFISKKIYRINKI